MVPNFEEKLEEYAHLLVEVGLNIQPGQMVNLAAPVECAPLARLCARVALDRGAKDVLMDWRDDFVTRERYLKADSQVFEEFPHYLKEKYEWLVQEGCTALSIIGSDPEMLLSHSSLGEEGVPGQGGGGGHGCSVGGHLLGVPHHRRRKGGGALAGARGCHGPAGQAAQ